MKFTVYDEDTGRVCYGGDAHAPHEIVRSGKAVLEGVKHTSGWIADGVHHELPTAPSAHHDFDWVSKTWQDRRTLQDLRAMKWDEIKTLRDALEATSFPYLGKIIDSDARSAQRITAAVQSADAAQRAGIAFSMDWTCADNSALTLDGPAMQGMPVALAQYADALHQHARALRARIEEATTFEELNLIIWDANA